MNDTNPRINKIFFDMIMKKSNEERLKMGFSMFETARKLSLLNIKNKKKWRIEIFLRFYGDDFDEIRKKRIIERLSECSFND